MDEVVDITNYTGGEKDLKIWSFNLPGKLEPRLEYPGN